MAQNIRSRIAAFGSHFPDQVLTNKDLEKIVDTSDQWIVERTGIRERRKLRDGENNSDIAAAAALKALKAAGVSPQEVDMIIGATTTPDRWMPSLASQVQVKIGATNGSACFDMLAACAGWVMGLQMADAMIRSGRYRNILVLGTEALTRFVDWSDRTTCVLFGDGAGVSLVQPCKAGDPGEIIETILHTDGRVGDALDMPGCGSRSPATPEVLEKHWQYIHMNGQEIFKHAVRNMTSVCEEVLASQKLTIDQIDWFIPHQANIRIIESVGKKLNVPMEKVALNVHKYGNTSSATIPTCFDEYTQTGKIKRGDLVLMTTFGGGLNWAGGLIRW
jgi:3-oxoacyl-[acyl-carrier-protein] synthase III